MLHDQDENSLVFRPADEFLRDLEKQRPLAPHQPSSIAYKRASLAHLAASRGVKSKISLWEKTGPVQHDEQSRYNKHASKAVDEKKLAPVSEVDEDRRSSTSSLLSQGAQAALNAILPSPATKQDRAARQEAVRFPSVMFGTRQSNKQPKRAPFPKARQTFDSKETEQWQLSAGDDRKAYEDSDSGSEWHDASEIQAVTKDNAEISISSEATTVVPTHEADDDSTAESMRPEGVPALHHSESPPLPVEQQNVPRRHHPSSLLASEIFHSALDMLPLNRSFEHAADGGFGIQNSKDLGQIDTSIHGTALENIHGEEQQCLHVLDKQLAEPQTSISTQEQNNCNPICTREVPFTAVPADQQPSTGQKSSSAADPAASTEVIPTSSSNSKLQLDSPSIGQGVARTLQQDSVASKPQLTKADENRSETSLRREFSEANLHYLIRLQSPGKGVSTTQQEVAGGSPAIAPQLEGLPSGDVVTPCRPVAAALPDQTLAPANTPISSYLPMQQQQRFHHSSVLCEEQTIQQDADPKQQISDLEQHQICAVPLTVPMTPYAATEYDGDDVVMGDAGTPCSILKYTCRTPQSVGSRLVKSHKSSSPSVQTEVRLPSPNANELPMMPVAYSTNGALQRPGEKAPLQSEAAPAASVSRAAGEGNDGHETFCDLRRTLSNTTTSEQSFATASRETEALKGSFVETESSIPIVPAQTPVDELDHRPEADAAQEATMSAATPALRQPNTPTRDARGRPVQPEVLESTRCPDESTLQNNMAHEGQVQQPDTIAPDVVGPTKQLISQQAKPQVNEEEEPVNFCPENDFSAADAHINAAIQPAPAENSDEDQNSMQAVATATTDVACSNRPRLYAVDTEVPVDLIEQEESFTVTNSLSQTGITESLHVADNLVPSAYASCESQGPFTEAADEGVGSWMGMDANFEEKSDEHLPALANDDTMGSQPGSTSSAATSLLQPEASSPQAAEAAEDVSCRQNSLQPAANAAPPSSNKSDVDSRRVSGINERCPASEQKMQSAESHVTLAGAGSEIRRCAATAASPEAESTSGASDNASEESREDDRVPVVSSGPLGATCAASKDSNEQGASKASSGFKSASKSPEQLGLRSSSYKVTNASPDANSMLGQTLDEAALASNAASPAEQRPAVHEANTIGSSAVAAACKYSPSSETAEAEQASASVRTSPLPHLAGQQPTSNGTSAASAADAATCQLQPVNYVRTPAVSFGNPLAASLTLYDSRRNSAAVSPAHSSLTGAFSNSNPLYAGTPGHATPASVTFKTFSSSRTDGTLLSRESGDTPASVGKRLAERLQEVASQLQQNSVEPLRLASTPGQGLQTPGPSKFAADVAAMLQALEQGTPATALFQRRNRAIAVATTVQRRPGASRLSMAASGHPAGISMFDLEGFDVDGNHTAGRTPVHSQALALQHPLGKVAGADGHHTAASSPPADAHELREEVHALQDKVALLEEERELAVGMLAGYQGSISQLQDQHSAALLKIQTENTLLKSEIEAVRKDKARVEDQFRQLYHEKYLPLKEEAGVGRQQVTSLRTLLAQEEVKARKAEHLASSAEQDADNLRRELSEAKGDAAAALETAAAAQQSEAKLEQKMKSEAKRNSQACAAMEAELTDVKAKHGLLTRQYDEAVHKLNLAKQARERAHSEMERKEEEICALQVKLKDLEGVLLQYKRENSKFFDVKERYKATIAALEKDVLMKEKEKQDLVNMCSELMGKLESEGLSLDD